MSVRRSISRTNDELDDPQFQHTVSRVSTGALTDVESGENGRDPGTQQPFQPTDVSEVAHDTAQARAVVDDHSNPFESLLLPSANIDVSGSDLPAVTTMSNCPNASFRCDHQVVNCGAEAEPGCTENASCISLRAADERSNDNDSDNNNNDNSNEVVCIDSFGSEEESSNKFNVLQMQIPQAQAITGTHVIAPVSHSPSNDDIRASLADNADSRKNKGRHLVLALREKEVKELKRVFAENQFFLFLRDADVQAKAKLFNASKVANVPTQMGSIMRNWHVQSRQKSLSRIKPYSHMSDLLKDAPNPLTYDMGRLWFEDITLLEKGDNVTVLIAPSHRILTASGKVGTWTSGLGREPVHAIERMIRANPLRPIQIGSTLYFAVNLTVRSNANRNAFKRGHFTIDEVMRKKRNPPVLNSYCIRPIKMGNLHTNHSFKGCVNLFVARSSEKQYWNRCLHHQKQMMLESLKFLPKTATKCIEHVQFVHNDERNMIRDRCNEVWKLISDGLW